MRLRSYANGFQIFFSLSIILYKNPISINFYDEAIVKPLMNV